MNIEPATMETCEVHSMSMEFYNAVDEKFLVTGQKNINICIWRRQLILYPMAVLR